MAGRSGAVSRGMTIVIFLVVAHAPAADAQDTIPLGPQPALVRADQVGRFVAGDVDVTILVHAGVEGGTQVEVRETGMEPSATVRSAGRWTALDLAVSSPDAEVRVVPRGAVWVVAFEGARTSNDRVAFDCSSLGQFVFWEVEAGALRILRSASTAPFFESYGPRAGVPVPDEPAVLNHTLFLDPTQTPLYLRTVENGQACAGNLTLEAVRDGSDPALGAAWRELVFSLAVIGALLVAVLGGIWTVARRRERRRRETAPPHGSVAVLYGRVFPLRQVVMIRPRRVLWSSFVLVLVLAYLPAVGAQSFGVDRATPDDPLDLPESQEIYHLCVALRVPGEEVVLLRERPGEDPERVVFHPTRDAVDCRPADGGAYRAEEGELDVLVIARSPREVGAPSVVRLERVGSALLIEHPTADTDLGLLLDRPGLEAVVVTQRDLGVLASATGIGEKRLVLAETDGWDGGGIFVVYTAAGEGGGAVLVDWQDPSWYRRAPSIGHVAVVVAIALFLMLYHGRSPRVYG